MELEKAKFDYLQRKHKRHMRFRKCGNCKFYKIGDYHDMCLVKDKLDVFNINALICRYYIKNMED